MINLSSRMQKARRGLVDPNAIQASELPEVEVTEALDNSEAKSDDNEKIQEPEVEVTEGKIKKSDLQELKHDA